MNGELNPDLRSSGYFSELKDKNHPHIDLEPEYGAAPIDAVTAELLGAKHEESIRLARLESQLESLNEIFVSKKADLELLNRQKDEMLDVAKNRRLYPTDKLFAGDITGHSDYLRKQQEAILCNNEVRGLQDRILQCNYAIEMTKLLLDKINFDLANHSAEQ